MGSGDSRNSQVSRRARYFKRPRNAVNSCPAAKQRRMVRLECKAIVENWCLYAVAPWLLITA